MAGNITALIIIAVLAWVALRFGPARAAPQQRRTLVLFLLLLGAFLLFNLFSALVAARGLTRAALLPAVTSATGLNGVGDGEDLVVAGTVSRDNRDLGDGIVARVECDETACYEALPSRLLISLLGVDVGVENQDYLQRDWPVTRFLEQETYTLSVDDPLVVVGSLARGGDRPVLAAVVVYGGPYADYSRYAWGRALTADLLLLLNLALLGWMGWTGYRRLGGATTPTASP